MKRVFAQPTKNSFYVVFFGFYLIMLICGFILNTLDPEYVLAHQYAEAMLFGAIFISFVLSSLSCMRFGFNVSYDKSVKFTVLLFALGFGLFALGSHLLHS